jgi:hypothetical protein
VNVESVTFQSIAGASSCPSTQDKKNGCQEHNGVSLTKTDVLIHWILLSVLDLQNKKIMMIFIPCIFAMRNVCIKVRH